jgi:RNA polymerase sigma factor (sigma-70 family)
MPVEAKSAIEAACRIESARLTAALTRIMRDVDLAEELAQDAFVAALEQWPGSGIPQNTGAWLMTAAKRRAIDRLRRDQRLQRKYEALGVALEQLQRETDPVTAADEIDDDVLRLIFIACHPTLSREAQVALTLRLIGGLTTDEIARAFLVPSTWSSMRVIPQRRARRGRGLSFALKRCVWDGCSPSSCLQSRKFTVSWR